MVRGVRQGVLTTTELKNRLNLIKEDKTKYTDLLLKALELKKITKEEFNNNLPTKETTLKCYLYSIIKDQNTRNKIENYVLTASELYSRGTFIANLIAFNYLGDILEQEIVPKYDFQPNIEITNLFTLVQNKIFKQIFLPERWPTSGEERLEVINNILQRPNITNMLPNWQNVMSVSGWDNSLNRMYSKFRANIQNHIMVHLENNLKRYFAKVELDTNTSKDQMFNSLIKPLRPIIMHSSDFEHVVKFRNFFNMAIDDYFPKSLEFTKEIFQLVMFLTKQGVTKGTYLPISTLGRKYCYLDAKILRFLLPDVYKAKKKILKREPVLIEILDLTTDSFKHYRKKLRKNLRKNSKAKKWRRVGYSKMPSNAKIYSLETDGIGLSICLHKSINILNKAIKNQDQDITKEDSPVVIGMDLGRAKAYAAAISLDPTKKPESLTFTRRKYYFEMKHRIRKRFEITRSQQPDIQTALQDLSQNNGTKNILHYLTTLEVHYDNLKQEYLIDKERALWRMRLYRLKTRSLDKAVQRVFEKAQGRPIVLGVGNAKFPSSGQGERSMPTTQFVRTILKAKYKYHNKVKLLGINEFKTTVCCCGCGNQTTPVYLSNLNPPRPSRRLRLCTQCNTPGDKVRDRDIQAARNILWLTQYQFLGADRPWYLSRLKKISTT